jgi:hypothetical protein
VTVHADAVAEAVREVRLPGPEARLLDDAARGGIHHLGFQAQHLAAAKAA